MTVTIACLKTAVGLITSCGEAFAEMFPGGPSYRTWAVGFCTGSFLIANLGLDAIIEYSMPVLMFLYPLAIVLVLLTLTGKWFGDDRRVLQWAVGFTAAAALFDCLGALPEGTKAFFHLRGLTEAAARLLPLSGQGFGWVCPAAAGTVIGLLVHAYRIKSAEKAD